MSFREHAEREMRLAGFYDEDSDYGGMIPGAVLALVEAHSKEGHSGGSHELVIEIFKKVICFKTLTPLTSNYEEWFKHDHQVGGVDCWQSIRCPSAFSQDGGKTWYDIDDPEKKNWPAHKINKGDEMQEKTNRFDYVKYDQFSQEKQVSFKEKFSFLAKMVEEDLSNGRAKALVLTKLEEAYMWVGKAIRDEQIEQGMTAPLQEERGKE